MKGKPVCPDCRQDMEEGFIPDATYGQFLQVHWHPGAPESTSFFGIPAGVKFHPEAAVPVTTWRCPSCGLLRSHAG